MAETGPEAMGLTGETEGKGTSGATRGGVSLSSDSGLRASPGVTVSPTVLKVRLKKRTRFVSKGSGHSRASFKIEWGTGCAIGSCGARTRRRRQVGFFPM